MSARPRPLSLSGSLELNVDRLVEPIVAEVLAGLDGGEAGRHTENFAPQEMPPRGTVQWGEHDSNEE